MKLVRLVLLTVGF